MPFSIDGFVDVVGPQDLSRTHKQNQRDGRTVPAGV